MFYVHIFLSLKISEKSLLNALSTNCIQQNQKRCDRKTQQIDRVFVTTYIIIFQTVKL